MKRPVIEIEHELATAHHRVLDLERELVEALREARREADMLRAAYEIPEGTILAPKIGDYLPHDTHG